MINSEKGKKIISRLPLERILTESDAPYNSHSSIQNVLNFLSVKEELIYNNFKELITNM